MLAGGLQGWIGAARLGGGTGGGGVSGRGRRWPLRRLRHGVGGRLWLVLAAAAPPHALDGGPHLRLAAHHDEDEDALQRVDQVGDVPEILGTSDEPRDDVRQPCHTHHDHQLHAHVAKGCSETGAFIKMS